MKYFNESEFVMWFVKCFVYLHYGLYKRRMAAY